MSGLKKKQGLPLNCNRSQKYHVPKASRGTSIIFAAVAPTKQTVDVVVRSCRCTRGRLCLLRFCHTDGVVVVDVAEASRQFSPYHVQCKRT
jgi:hypothetical protein